MADDYGYPGAGDFVPGDEASLSAVASAAAGCRGCDLYRRAFLRSDDRDAEYAGLVDDLRVAASALHR